jgi:eukaryotic-like serine/threonine-protein kinase
MISLKVEPVDRDGPNQRGSPGPLTGRLLAGRWRLGEVLGQGGMSSVYAATHRNGKQFAIKVLRPDLYDRERTKWRFLREGYIANRVSHEGVVAVLDDVTENGFVFLVMELLEGVTVEQYGCERGGILPIGEVLAIADGVLDILSAAHVKGVVHRDIKPSNLFLTAQATLKLLDFGIASLREASGIANATMNGALLGTPGFMAPEQARGRWKEIDARTDLWGVGALMFRLLTGRLVHECESTHESVVAAATQPARSLGSVDRSLPKSLVELVDRALESDQGARWQTAVEMQAAVRTERARLSSSELPRPSCRASVSTVDEAMSVAGTANELPSRLESAAIARLTRSPRWWLFFGYGAMGAVVLLWIIGGRTELATPENPKPPSITAKPMQHEAPPLSTVEPAPALTVVSVATPIPSQPIAVANSVQSAASLATRPPQKNEARSTKPAQVAAPAVSAGAAPRSPRRLEDVLNERR